MNIKTIFALACFALLFVGGVYASAITNSIHLTGQTSDGAGNYVTGSFNATFNVSQNFNCSSELDSDSTTLVVDDMGRWSYYFDTTVVSSEQLWVGYDISKTFPAYSEVGCIRYAPVAYTEALNPANDYYLNNDTSIWFGNLLTSNIYFDSLLDKLSIESSGEVYVNSANLESAGNVTANNYFIGNGSQLTDLPSSSLYWQLWSSTIYPLNNSHSIGLYGNRHINFYVDGIPKTFKYDTANNRFYLGDDLHMGQLLTGLKALEFAGTSTAPSTKDGTIYYNDTSRDFNFRENGAWLTLGGGVTSYWQKTGAMLHPLTAGDTLGIYGNATINMYVDGIPKTLKYDKTNNRFDLNDKLYSSSSIDGTNYLVAGTEIIDTSRNIADAEVGAHTIGTRGQSNFEALTVDIGDVTNYASFVADGELNLHGTARVKKILAYYPYDIGGIAGTYNGVVCAPSALGSLNGVYFKTYDKTAEESSNMMFALPPDYVDGTDIEIFFCFLTGGTAGDLTWQAGLTAISDGDLYTQAYTWATPQTITVPTTAWERDTARFTISGTGITKGDAVNVIIFRDTLNADTFNGDAYTCMVGIKYTSDRLGENT